ncbi:MAG: TonB-dependent receptor [Muribaculaceae bacterium]|nr:TonB-dependent receptor [Muribaculaceae bacterium]
MKKTRLNRVRIAHWQRFSRKSYSAFCSLSRVVAIGVLAVSTLQSAAAASPELKASGSEQQITSGEKEAPDGDEQAALELREVQVVSQATSISIGRAAQPVQIITGSEIAREPVATIADVLKLVSSIDVRQRGPMGIQTDINIDGGTHDQVTVLLNGVDITSPQTGHYSGDWPVNVDDIERIEILEGAGSRITGSSSLMGIVNIVTKPARENGIRLYAEGGSFLTFGARASGDLNVGKVRNRLSGLWSRSDGGTQNSDYRRYQGYYQGAYASDSWHLSWQFGGSSQGFGANTFYSAAYPNQHDQVYRLVASIGGAWKGRVRIEPLLYWNRLGDHYQLIRDTHTGENFHRSDVIGGKLNLSAQWVAGETSAGVGVRYEHLFSTALGTPMDPSQCVDVPGHEDVKYTKAVSRTGVNIFAEHNVSVWKFDISAGVNLSMNTGYDRKFRFYPGIDLAFRPNAHWRIVASWNRGYRMPTFTDLYYKSVVIEGNKDIKPEKMQSWKLEGRYANSFLAVSARGFYHQGRDMIDWVMYTPDDIYHSTGFDLDNYGFTLSAQLNFKSLLGDRQPLQTLSADYTQIHQKRHDTREIYKSNYALEYLRNKVVLSLGIGDWRIGPGRLGTTWSFRWVDRAGSYIEYVDGKTEGTLRPYSPYAVLDARVCYSLKHWDFTLTANNLTNHRYYDFGNVPQPGIWVMAGVGAKF